MRSGQVRREAASYTQAAAALDAQLLTGSCFDLDLICEGLGDAPLDEVVATTVRPALSWQFAGNVARGPSLRGRPQAVCPACARARLFLLINAVSGSGVCSDHALELQHECRCGNAIELFRGQQPFTCHACALDYGELPQVRASDRAIDRARQEAFVIEALLAATPELRARGPRRIKAALLRLATGRAGDLASIREVRSSHGMTLTRIAAWLIEWAATPWDLLEACATPNEKQPRR